MGGAGPRRQLPLAVSIGVAIAAALSAPATMAEAARTLHRVNCTPASYMVGQNLSHCSLHGKRLNLSTDNATSAVFDSATLTGAHLDGTTLVEANLGNVTSGNLTGMPVFQIGSIFHVVNGFVVGSNASLAGGNFSGVTLSGLSLYGANLAGASFKGASFNTSQLENERFTATDLESIDFTRAHLTNVTVPLHADLENAKFHKAKIRGSHFVDADLQGDQFTGATLNGDDLHGARFYPYPRFRPQAPTIPSNTSNVVSISSLAKATVTNTDLHGANLIAANLDGATFTNSNLANVKATDAEMVHTSFNNDNLGGTNLHHAFLYDTTFSHSNLAGADLAGATMIGVRFVGADLRGATLPAGPRVSGARWIDTICPDGLLSTVHGGRCAASRGSDVALATGSGILGAPSAASRCPTTPPTGLLTQSNFEGCVFNGVDWANCAFNGAPHLPVPDFSGATFINSNLSGCNLEFDYFVGATFLHSNLSGANLSYTNFTDAVLAERSSLAHANLNNATFKNTSITNSDLSRTYESGWSLAPGGTWGVDFYGAYLGSDNLDGASLGGAASTFSKSIFAGSTVIGASLGGGTSFAGAALVGSTVASSRFDHDSFRGSSLLDGTVLRAVQVGATNWSASTFGNFVSVGVTDVLNGRPAPPALPAGWVLNRDRMVGPGALLGRAMLARDGMTRLDLADARLAHADLIGSDLRGAQMTAADLTGANLAYGNLQGAFLVDSSLRGASLVGANLTGADLQGANLGKSTLVGTKGPGIGGPSLRGVVFNTTICPDGTNSDNDGGTCVGHTSLKAPTPISQAGRSALTVPTAGTGEQFSAQLSVAASVGPATYQVASSSTGLEVSPSGRVRTPLGPLAVGTYGAWGTVTDTSGNAGAWTFSLTVTPTALAQSSPTAQSVDQDDSSDGFAAQLELAGAAGTTTFVVTTMSAHLSVSASGLVTTIDGPLDKGSYTVAGSVTDALGDVGSWTFTLTVTCGGSGHEDGVLRAPANRSRPQRTPSRR